MKIFLDLEVKLKEYSKIRVLLHKLEGNLHEERILEKEKYKIRMEKQKCFSQTIKWILNIWI